MSWKSAMELYNKRPRVPKAQPSRITACLSMAKGRRYLRFYINGPLGKELGITLGWRVQVDFGDGEHEGLTRLKFSPTGSGYQYHSSGGRRKSCNGSGRIDIAIDPDLFSGTKRSAARECEYVWDAKSRTLITHLPAPIIGNKFTDDLRAIIENEEDKERAFTQ